MNDKVYNVDRLIFKSAIDKDILMIKMFLIHFKVHFEAMHFKTHFLLTKFYFERVSEVKNKI